MRNFILRNIVFFTIINTLSYANSCTMPSSIVPFVIKSGAKNLLNIDDVRRNYNLLKHMCATLISFKEGFYNWKMLLVTNPKQEHGLFWFLPHDNENSAFNSAVYAISRYGGGFLSIVNSNKRYNNGQDPNRNFSYSLNKLQSCKEQRAPSPIYTKTVFSVIDYYKSAYAPYLALHNNTNNGGISILKKSSKVASYLAYSKKQILNGKGLQDQDNLIYMAGLSTTPPSIINSILHSGISVKYEVVNKYNNDCSMSNFVVLEKGTSNYFNIEAQHGYGSIQKKMIDILVNLIRR